MLQFAFILAFTAFMAEMIFASKVSFWRQIAAKSKLANLIMSLLFSYTLASLFGAAGLIAMTAAILAMLMSIPGYAALAYLLDSEHAKEKGGDLMKYYWEKFSSVMSDFIILTYKTLRVITFPVWGTRAVVNKVKAFRA